MKEKILAVVFIFFFGFAKPQSTYVDSLKLVLKTAGSDSLKCFLLSELSETAPEEEWQSFNAQLKKLSEEKLKTNLSSSLKKFYTQSLATAINNEGVIFQNSGDTKAAIDCYTKSYELNKSTHNASGMATALNNTGSLYEKASNDEKALELYLRSLQLSEEEKDLSGKANTLTNIASVYESMGNIPKAFDYYEQALELSQRIKDEWQYSLALRKAAALHYYEYEYDKALEYWQKCVDISTKNNDWQGLAELLNAIGIAYMNQSSYEKALANFSRSLEINTKYGFKNGSIQSLQNLGLIQRRYFKNTKKALGYFFQALDLASSSEHYDLQPPLLSEIAKVYLQENNGAAAQKYAEQAFSLAKTNKSPAQIEQVATVLKDVYKYNGNYKQALEIQELMTEMNEKLFNEKNKNATIRSHYKVEYQAKAITDSLKAHQQKLMYEASLKQEKTNRYLLLLCIMVLCLFAVIFGQQFYHRQKLKVSGLRNKIASDLHDEVGSSLSSIKLFAGSARILPDKEKQENVLKKIEQTSLETIENMSDIVWSIQPKNDNFALVIEKIEQFGRSICQSAGIEFELKTDFKGKPVLNIEQRKNFYLVFKEAVNNAVKHSGASKIKVDVAFFNKLLILEISDNGKGFDTNIAGNGNGVSNMQQRAKDILAQLKLTSGTQGTRLILELKTT